MYSVPASETYRPAFRVLSSATVGTATSNSKAANRIDNARFMVFLPIYNTTL